MSLKLGQASREAERGWSLRSVMREIEEEGADARCPVRERRERGERGGIHALSNHHGEPHLGQAAISCQRDPSCDG